MNTHLNWKTGLAVVALGILIIGRLTPMVRTGYLGNAGQAGKSASVIRTLERIGNDNPALQARAVFIQRLKTGEVLFSEQERERLPIASLTKLMTGLLLAEHGEPIAWIPFSNYAKRTGAPDGKRSGVSAGEEIKAEDVEKLLLAASDHDAAYAAAEFAGTGTAWLRASSQERVQAFIALMNQRAADLGMADTHFANPAGNDDPENFSTARDLARLAENITSVHPELWAASRIMETFVFGKNGERHGVVNTNPLLAKFPAIFGSKTGFEDQAQGTLLILYQLGRDELIVIVILKSPDRFGDGQRTIRWIDENFKLPTHGP